MKTFGRGRAGDEVLELVLNGVAANRGELLQYGLAEEITHFKRRWFVVEDALAVLPGLLKHGSRPEI